LVLEWIGKLTKPILWLVGFGTVIVAAFEQLRKP